MNERKTNKIAVENVNVPGSLTNVDAVKYLAMKKAFLKILPKSSPGLTQKEIQQQVKEHLPDESFRRALLLAGGLKQFSLIWKLRV